LDIKKGIHWKDGWGNKSKRQELGNQKYATLLLGRKGEGESEGGRSLFKLKKKGRGEMG